MSQPMPVFRENLLEGQVIAFAGGVDSPVARALEALGADCRALSADLDEDHAQEWASNNAPLAALVCDVRDEFATLELTASLERVWTAVRAVANGAMIPGAGGKLVLLAPRPEAGRHAHAARAALENLARTLSVEWARYGITATAVLPGADTGDEQLAELAGFLISRAGDYFSGCKFELGLIRTS